MRFVHRLLKRGVQGVIIRLFSAQIFLHQVFVHLDNLIENGGVAALDRVKIGISLRCSAGIRPRSLPPLLGRLIGRHSGPNVSRI